MLIRRAKKEYYLSKAKGQRNPTRRHKDIFQLAGFETDNNTTDVSSEQATSAVGQLQNISQGHGTAYTCPDAITIQRNDTKTYSNWLVLKRITIRQTSAQNKKLALRNNCKIISQGHGTAYTRPLFQVL